MKTNIQLSQEYKSILKQNDITIVTIFDPDKEYIEVNLMKKD